MECEQMIDAARTANRLLAVGLYKRFFPSSRYLKTLFASGQLGALRHFTITEGGPFKWPAASPSFFNKAQTPGGVLLDIGVHVLDLLAWWLGEPAGFRYADDAMGGLETNSRIDLSYGNGATGVVHLSRDWATANQYLFVFERGAVTWKVNDANGLTVQLADAPAALRAQLVTPLEEKSIVVPPQLQLSNPQSFIAQLQNVVVAIRGKENLLVPGEEGIRSLRFIEACYRAKTLIEQPWLTAEENRRAKSLFTAV
jgi:predicted dehydrogenase